MVSLAHVEEGKLELVKDIHRLTNLGACLLDSANGGVMVQKVVWSCLGTEIKEKQMLHPILVKIKSNLGMQKVMVFEISGKSTLRYQGKLCVPDVDGLRQRILAEVNESLYIVHPSSMKNYHDLKEMY